ncbi:MAG: hypothetical protein NC084_12910 [Bacteroides sp.]|nr:hypothetical protein [Roseburia sp.]MCM1463595.1 hypothetical protein [Bacteroides sp.]
MPNTITLPKNYTALLDEVYQKESVTAGLIGDPSMTRAGTNVNEICYPQISLQGLGDYDRNSGYTDNSISLEWKTVRFNYDRGTRISVDTMDNQESFNIAFGRAGGELMRTKVAPEADAFTFATIAGTAGISVAEPTVYADAAAFLAALIEAKTKMDEDEVPEENRILYATPTLINGLLGLDSYKSKEIVHSFSEVKRVPQSRFYTAIDLLDGKSAGEEIGGYKKSAEGFDINFMIIHKPAVIKFDKHIANDVIPPENNPASDAYILKYRKYGLVDLYANKVAGVYLSYKPAN